MEKIFLNMELLSQLYAEYALGPEPKLSRLSLSYQVTRELIKSEFPFSPERGTGEIAMLCT